MLTDALLREPGGRALEAARRRGIIAPEETMAGAARRAATALGAVDAALEGRTGRFAAEVEEALIAGRIGLSSQLLAALGRSRRVAACTVIPTPPGAESDRIRRLVLDASAASAAGMGCGIDVSTFADPGLAVSRLNVAMLPLHRRLVAAGRRPPAFMVTCDAAHPRVTGFVDAKAGADFGAWVANLSVRFDGDVTTYARLRDAVAFAAHRNGEPGVLFGAPAEADNPTPQYALASTAPCAEVFMAPDERCVFVSVNLAAHVTAGGFDWEAFDESVRLAVRIGDDAVEEAASDAPRVVADRRRIGVGICGLHSCLIALGIPYAAGVPFATAVAECHLHAAHRASCELARRRGPFPAWGTSRWRDPAWLRRKAAHRGGAVAPSAWARLESEILAHGVRNAVIVAFPPTGIVSELLGVSKSYEPHFDLRDGDGVRGDVAALLADGVVLDAQGQPAAAGPDHLLACARQIDPRTHLAIHAAFCLLADEAGSKTVNLPASATVGAVGELLDEARELGLKGLTVFRDGCLDEAA